MGCLEISPIAPSDFPYQLMISQEDLPDGWYRENGGPQKEPNAVASHGIGFVYRPEKPSRILTNYLTIYKDEVTAKTNFADWEAKWIPTPDWHEIEGTTFKPQNSNDLIVFKCFSLEINGDPIKSCTYIQQHSKYISLLIFNLDTQTLTLAQIDKVLSTLDTRLQSAQ